MNPPASSCCTPIAPAVARACLALLPLCATACDPESVFGPGGGADVAVTTPGGVQSGSVVLVYTLTGDDGDTTGIRVKYSRDGASFLAATEGTGGDGTSDLSVGEAGAIHTFVWDSQADLPGERLDAARVKITPTTGLTDTTGSFRVHNSEFLVTVDDHQIGRARLFRVDVRDGTSSTRDSVLTGGEYPFDVLYNRGFFFVAHRGTNDVAVLEVDEETTALAPVAGSPFACDGLGSRFLAADTSRVYVSNTASESISIFDLDRDTGELTPNSYTNVTASGCRDLVVRSSRLYVADGANDRILIFDIATDGELFTNADSPATAGGLNQPECLAVVGGFIYASNLVGSTVSGFSVAASGGLNALGGTPYSLSTGPLVRMATNSVRLYGVDAGGRLLVALAADAIGDLTERTGSPHTLEGDGYAVATRGGVVVAGTQTIDRLHYYTIGGAGELTEVEGSPQSNPAPTIAAAISAD